MAPFGSVSTQPLATWASDMFGMTFMIRQTVVKSLAGNKLVHKLLTNTVSVNVMELYSPFAKHR